MPDWLDPPTLRWVILLAIAALLLAMFMVVRFVQKMMLKFVLFAVLAGLGLSLWIQRTDLQDCADTCACSLYGFDVQIDESRGCG